MGKLTIRLDQPNWQRLEEPGWSKRFTGAQLAKELAGAGNFWNPPGSEWLLPRPKHFSPTWYQSADLENHVLREERWTWAGGLENVRETQWTRRASGEDYPHNQWIVVPDIPADLTALDSTDYDALFAEAVLTPPANIKTLGFANLTPTGFPLDGADYHPFLKFQQYPQPNDRFVFGFSNLAFVFDAGFVACLRSPKNDRKTWELLPNGFHAMKDDRATDFFTGPYPFVTDGTSITTGYFSCIPVGPDHIAVSLGMNGMETHLIRLRDSGETEGAASRLFPPGPWWIAAPAGNKMVFQLQVVGYEEANTASVDPKPTFFDLSQTYKPTQQPSFRASYLLPVSPGAPTLTTTYDGTGNEVTVAPVSRGEELIVGIRDEGYAIWTSDGTKHKGTFRIRLRPWIENHSYLPVQLREITLTFPEKLIERSSVSLTLDDTQWFDLACDLSLRETLGKRITFSVWEKDESPFGGLGLDLRSGYPCEIWEEPDDPEDPEQDAIRRAVGWVYEVDGEEIRSENEPDTLVPQRRVDYEVRGISERANQKWLFPPEIVNPAGGGHLSHTFAVQEAFRKSACDVTDTDLFFWYPDPYADTDIDRLPGTPADGNVAPGLDNDGAFNPDWSEPKIEYATRIATEWRGWRLYESGRRVNYHPDILVAIQAGEAYHSSTTIYLTHALAEAAGYPGQYFLATPRRYKEPFVCNAVRITGKEGKGEKPNQSLHVQEINTRSVTEAADPNFWGELLVLPVVAKLGIGLRALKQLARNILLLKGRRIRGWVVEVPLAPWQMGPGVVDVGYIVNLQGRGDYLIVNLSWKVLGPNGSTGYHYRTQMVCIELPENATAGDTAGGYPGSGVVS